MKVLARIQRSGREKRQAQPSAAGGRRADSAEQQRPDQTARFDSKKGRNLRMGVQMKLNAR